MTEMPVTNMQSESDGADCVMGRPRQLLPPHRDCLSSEYPLNGIQLDAGVVASVVSSMFLLSCNLVGPAHRRAFFYGGRMRGRLHRE